MYKDYKGKWIADKGNGVYQNPILFSDYSDPDVIRVGNDYFMVASSFTYFPGVPVLHSTDLVNWELISYAVEKMPFEDYDEPQHGKGVWAPSIRYHNGFFYVYFGAPDEGIFMAKTNDPFGKWEPLVTVVRSKGWIDTCPFWDDDGNAYLIRGVAKSRIGYKSILFLHKMSADGTRLLDDGVKVFDGRINHPTLEGPKLYKRNGYYYIMAPAGGVQQGWQMVARSKNIYGPYEHRVVLHQGDSPINGPHQGGWIDTPNGENWFIHFQDLEAYGRVVHLQPARWVDDWLEIGVDTNNDHIGEPVLEHKKPEGVSAVIPPVDSDEFEGDSLSLQWQWQAHLYDNFYEMTGKGVRLFALPYKGKNISSAANLMCELMKRPNFIATAKFRLALNEGEGVGLAVTGGSYTGVSAVKGKGGIEVSQVNYILAKKEDTTEERGEAVVLNNDELYLRLEVKYPCLVTPYVSADGENYVKLGEPVQYEVSRKSWVGGKIGVWCVNHIGKNMGGSAVLEYVRVE